MALGAEANRIRRSVLVESLLTVGIGIVVGLIAAGAMTRYIKAFLFGMSPVDPTTILSAIILMLVVAGLASYLPARRASLVDPIIALRHE
jgi:ABC-type antimicrobial peptide transport system permease subunit